MENKEMKILENSELEQVSGGFVVVDDENDKVWLVRRNGTVISPVPDTQRGVEFAKAYGESTKIMTKEEYKRFFGRDLVW